MRGLCLLENLTITGLVPQGRLNLAQDAVLGRDSRDEKSRGDDWKLPASLKGTAFKGTLPPKGRLRRTLSPKVRIGRLRRTLPPKVRIGRLRRTLPPKVRIGRLRRTLPHRTREEGFVPGT